jgi:Diacylglycerol acyltransferase
MGVETCKSSENSANSEMVPQRTSSSLCAVFNQTVDICCSVLLAWRSYLTGFKKCRLTGCEAFLEKMAKRFLGVEFVDILHVPLHRRLETLAVFQWIFTFLYLGFISFFLCFAFLFTPLFFIPLGYLVWYVYDYRTPEQGGRRSEWVRNWRVWSYFRSYFPVTLHKTVEIDPSENYLFIYHPHGILSVGAFSSFGTNACGFNQLFPGLRSTLLTLKYQFTFPIQRDYCMALGEY